MLKGEGIVTTLAFLGAIVLAGVDCITLKLLSDLLIKNT